MSQAGLYLVPDKVDLEVFHPSVDDFEVELGILLEEEGVAHPVDPGSDVDWDPPEDTEAASSSRQPSVRRKVSPEMRPFPLKRRLRQKTNVQKGFKAVRPAICPESRLSRELGAPLYSVQLG